MGKKTSKAKSKKTAKKTNRKSSKVESPAQGKISFDYIKSNQFRVIRVDGVHGGIAPKANIIQMAFFSERQPIPRRETFELKQGQLGARIYREERDAVIREVEVEALIDLDTARSINKWLEEKIELMTQVEKRLKQDDLRAATKK